jgi:hypothetical protein
MKCRDNRNIPYLRKELKNSGLSSLLPLERLYGILFYQIYPRTKDGNFQSVNTTLIQLIHSIPLKMEIKEQMDTRNY